jgi:hypothetical protein
MNRESGREQRFLNACESDILAIREGRDKSDTRITGQQAAEDRRWPRKEDAHGGFNECLRRQLRHIGGHTANLR